MPGLRLSFSSTPSTQMSFRFYQLLQLIYHHSHFGKPLRPCARESWPPMPKSIHGDLCDLCSDCLRTVARHLARCLEGTCPWKS